ncbi:MAG: hypothetical protein ACYC6L_00340 [Anaerolineae bacterium]
MGYAPASLLKLISDFKHERRALASQADGLERLCSEYIEPLLALLGWDVANAHGAVGGRLPVERLSVTLAEGTRPVRAYLLHEQAYHYQRHHLVGVCVPPVGRCAPRLLAALDVKLSHSDVLIETLALTDFASLRFYDNTPTEPHREPLRRARLYTLPSWQYPAWWDKLSFPAALLFNRRRFEVYASKLRLWGGLPAIPQDDDGS